MQYLYSLRVVFFFFSLFFFSPYPAVDLRINDENRSDKERIHRLNQECFGDGPQPKLDFAQYKVVKATNIVLFFYNVNRATAT